MAYNTQLSDRIREYLLNFPKLKVEEKEMFRGLTFMINGKMCMSVSGEYLMCRFDPTQQEDVAEMTGFIPMIMKGKNLKGYCYVSPDVFRSKKNLVYWLELCLSFNSKAKASKKKK